MNEHPLCNYLVLENICRHLNKGSLSTCRLICRDWNAVASNILSTRYSNVLHAFDEDEDYHYPQYDGKAVELSLILTKSTNPTFLLQNLTLDFQLLRIKRFTKLLKRYGDHIKILELKKSTSGYWRRSGDFQKYLIILLTVYCKNLVFLKVEVESEQYDEDEDSPGISRISKPLNIEHLSVVAPADYGTPVDSELQFLLEIIKSSPKLKILNWAAASYFVQDLGICKTISNELQHRTCRLEEFSWKFCNYINSDSGKGEKQENIMQLFNLISRVQFGRLKKLSLSNVTLSPKMVKQLTQLFRGIGPLLENLLLKDIGVKLDENDDYGHLLFSTLTFQEILAACPNIKGLTIEAARNEQDWMLDLSAIKAKPYPTLRKLTLGHIILNDLESFSSIVEWFPNLRRLELNDIYFWYHSPTRKSLVVVDIAKVMETLKGLKQLQELYLRVESLYPAPPESYHLVWLDVLKVLQKVPKLKLVHITDDDYGSLYTLENFRDVLMHTVKFDLVGFHYFRGRYVEKDEKSKMLKFVQENCLPVAL